MRLQRRRHLRSLKRRKLEHQKEQKTEYEYVTFSSPLHIRYQFNCSLFQCPDRQTCRREKSQGRRDQGFAQGTRIIAPFNAHSGLRCGVLFGLLVACSFLLLCVCFGGRAHHFLLIWRTFSYVTVAQSNVSVVQQEVAPVFGSLSGLPVTVPTPQALSHALLTLSFPRKYLLILLWAVHFVMES
jgi:hypothetical protein